VDVDNEIPTSNPSSELIQLAVKAVDGDEAALDAYHELKWGGEIFQCKFCDLNQTWPGMCGACEERSNMNQLSDDEKLAALGIPSLMVPCSWDNFEMPKGGIFKEIEAWRGRPTLLVISGPPGRGKTHMAVAVVRRRIKEKGVGGVFWISDAEIGARLKGGFRDGEMAVEDQIRRARLLVIDDLGQSYQTAWIAETILPILCRRHDDGKPTILTTNLTHADIEEMDARLASRMKTALALSTRSLLDRRVEILGDHDTVTA
jgi:hypothetical protein